MYDVADDWTPIYDRTSLPGFYVAMGHQRQPVQERPQRRRADDRADHQRGGGHDHDRDPVRFRCPSTGHEVELGAFSRRREINAESSGTVMG